MPTIVNPMRMRLYPSSLAIVGACQLVVLDCVQTDAAFLTTATTATTATTTKHGQGGNHVPLSCLFSTAKPTQYTIDETVCPPTRPHMLHAAVTKACASLETFLARKPIARHTQQAFDSLVELIEMEGEELLNHSAVPIVLDSGCGTGRSTELLGKLYPDHVVIGVDRSFARLSKTKAKTTKPNNPHDDKDGPVEIDEPFQERIDQSDEEESSKRSFCQKVSKNTFLVRAELVDFWRCCQQQSYWTIAHHYVLYPNPYPTHTRLTQRWYAHPSFPLILSFNSQSITIRSNWRGYLEEFARAVEIAGDYYDGETNALVAKAEDDNSYNPAQPYLQSAKLGPIQRTDLTIAWTNFERKYDQVGEPTYELRLETR